LRIIRKSGYASDNEVITFGLRFVASAIFEEHGGGSFAAM
jgi:DNA-binding IclR family transcriptional regulator